MPQRKSVNIKVEWIADVIFIIFLNVLFQVRNLWISLCEEAWFRCCRLLKMAFLTISQLLLVVEKQECPFHREAAGTCKICASGAAPQWAVQLQAWATSLGMAQNLQAWCMSKSAAKGRGYWGHVDFSVQHVSKIFGWSSSFFKLQASSSLEIPNLCTLRSDWCPVGFLRLVG